MKKFKSLKFKGQVVEAGRIKEGAKAILTGIGNVMPAHRGMVKNVELESLVRDLHQDAELEVIKSRVNDISNALGMPNVEELSNEQVEAYVEAALENRNAEIEKEKEEARKARKEKIVAAREKLFKSKKKEEASTEEEVSAEEEVAVSEETEEVAAAAEEIKDAQEDKPAEEPKQKKKSKRKGKRKLKFDSIEDAEAIDPASL